MSLKRTVRSLGIMGVIYGSVWAQSLLHTSTANAQTVTQSMTQPAQPNCSPIFYQEPFTSRVPAPEGCPPTEFQRRTQTETEETSPEQTDTQDDTTETSSPTQALPTSGQNTLPDASLPLPESLEDPITTIELTEEFITISLTNNIGTDITYEVIGDTERRTLAAGETTVLRGIELPSTIALVRPDSGLVEISTSTERDKLNLSISAETGLDDTQGVVTIQDNGYVFVN